MTLTDFTANILVDRYEIERKSWNHDKSDRGVFLLNNLDRVNTMHWNLYIICWDPL